MLCSVFHSLGIIKDAVFIRDEDKESYLPCTFLCATESYRSPSATPSMVAGLPVQQQQQQSPPFPNGPSPPAPKQNKEWLTRAQPSGGVQRLDGRDVRTKSPVESARQSSQVSQLDLPIFTFLILMIHCIKIMMKVLL